jgi:haloalkane dehalogenase
MHYVDEGSGDAIVFVHGNPSWSFEFRNSIKELSKTYRCIAPDHIGFGLSDKPLDWSYLPQEHAENLETLLESLQLNNITLVVGDWGGPIGLSYAVKHSEKVKHIVITNTWLWSVENDWYYQTFSKLAGGPIGRFLIKRHNIFANKLVKALFGDKRKLTKEIHKHFFMPFENPANRKGNWTFPRQIIESSDWLESLWNQIDVLTSKKVLIAWGMKDIGFRKKELNKWIGTFPNAKVVCYSDAGHFVSEEKSTELVGEIRQMFS